MVGSAIGPVGVVLSDRLHLLAALPRATLPRPLPGLAAGQLTRGSDSYIHLWPIWVAMLVPNLPTPAVTCEPVVSRRPPTFVFTTAPSGLSRHLPSRRRSLSKCGEASEITGGFGHHDAEVRRVADLAQQVGSGEQ
jgi:hypothetical protein